jgi:hypothetical protein
MSRNPINIELRGLQTPRERVWDAVLLLDKAGVPFNKTTIQDNCNPMVSWTLVDDYTKALEKAGYLTRVGGVGPSQGVVGKPIEYMVAKFQREAPRVSLKVDKVTQGEGNEAMWRAMKVLPMFDYKDIAQAATLGTVQVKPLTAKVYVCELAKAGYLITMRPSKPGTPARYKLGKNTGMHAPAITRTKVVFDRNTGQVANLQTVQEICDDLE